MRSPNVWIGIGHYGESLLRKAVARLAVPALLGTATAASRPILCHFGAKQSGPLADDEEIAFFEKDFADGYSTLYQHVARRLDPSIRQGNKRGAGYFFLFGHADDLAALPDIDKANHWLWRLPDRLDFNEGYLVVIASVEPPLDLTEEQIAARNQTLTMRLSDVWKAMRVGTADYRHQLILLRPAGVMARPGDPESTSAAVDAAVLLFELLASLPDDPVQQGALRKLFEQQQGEIAPQPTCASYGIRSVGVEFSSVAVRVKRDVSLAIQRSMEGQATELELPDPLPSFAVPLPDVVEEDVAPLRFEFEPGYFEDSDDAIRRLNQEQGRIDRVTETWWEKQAWPKLESAEPTRRAAGQRLAAALRWLYGQITTRWLDPDISAVQLAEFLERLQARVAEENRPADEGTKITPLARPHFSRSIDRVRNSLANRPRAMSSLALICVVLIASGLMSYAAATWLGRTFETLDFLREPYARFAAATAVICLVATGCYWAWLAGPFDAIRAAVRSVHAEARNATRGVTDLRAQFAKFAEAVAQGEIVGRFLSDVADAEQNLRDLEAVILTEARSRDVDTERAPPNLFDEVTSYDANAGPAADKLSTDFRHKYIPIRISRAYFEGDGHEDYDAPTEFAPAQLRDVVEQFFAKEVLRPLASSAPLFSSKVLNDELVGNKKVDIHPLVLSDATMIELYVHHGYLHERRADVHQTPVPIVRNTLRRGDRYFWLATVPSLRLEQAMR